MEESKKLTESSIKSSTTISRSTSINKIYTTAATAVADDSIKGKVRNLCRLFDPAIAKLSKSFSSSFIRYLPPTDDKIVLYFTSLRGIRRTYEDCYQVRMIFRGFRVIVDERDVSMDAAYRKELQAALGRSTAAAGRSTAALPQVFIRGKYIGGADTVKRYYETGELARLVAGIRLREEGQGCACCGEVRFVPCSSCNGSRRLFEEDEGVVRRCGSCNENGLMRCPLCSSSSSSPASSHA